MLRQSSNPAPLGYGAAGRSYGQKEKGPDAVNGGNKQVRPRERICTAILTSRGRALKPPLQREGPDLIQGKEDKARPTSDHAIIAEGRSPDRKPGPLFMPFCPPEFQRKI